MEWVVTTGQTIEEAKDAALDHLGVDESDAEFEILEEPRQGLFGRQRGEARVRARVRPTAPRPKLDRRDRRRKTDDRPRNDQRAGDGSATAAAQPGPASEATSSDGPATRRPRRRTPNNSKEQEPAVSEETMTLAEQGAVAKRFLAGLTTHFGLPAKIDVVELEEDTLEVRVTGSDLGLLVGPRGATLSAVQELTRTVVQRQTPGRTGRLNVDVAGYRQRRREALEKFTGQVAADVLESGVQKALEPMGAADRKVVHDTANDIEGVRTASEGEEPRRRVVILPEAKEANPSSSASSAG